MNKKEKLKQTLEYIARTLCMDFVSNDTGKCWSFHGRPHREHNKPAIIHPEGGCLYFEYGQVYEINDGEEDLLSAFLKKP